MEPPHHSEDDSRMVLYTERGPWYAGVRVDPRFRQLLKKIGFNG